MAFQQPSQKCPLVASFSGVVQKLMAYVESDEELLHSAIGESKRTCSTVKHILFYFQLQFGRLSRTGR